LDQKEEKIVTDEINYLEICKNVLRNKNIVPVTGGLRNTCYKYSDGNNVLFVKAYNKDTQFSKHMSECRCVSEFYITKYLYDNQCSVAEPLFCDEKMQIGIYDFVEAKNLKKYGKVDMELCYLTMEELSKIHSLPVVYDINGCKFTDLSKEDLKRYLIDGINFLCELKYIPNIYNDMSFFQDIVDEIGKMNRVIGNTQLHDGNVMVSNEHSIWFCDFEKVCPHFPQMDIMSFIHCRNLLLNDEKKIIDHYIRINNIENPDLFYCVYNLLFIIDCLRILKKIKYNEDGLKVKWVEVNGKKIKKFEKTESDKGIRWNRERGESIENRLYEIQSNVYSNNELCRKLRKLVNDIAEK
jgi:hypothetical protein